MSFESDYKSTTTVPVLKVQFKYKAVFNLSRLYEVMVEWMNDNGYYGPFGGTNYIEKKFIQEVSGGMKNLFFTLEGEQPAKNDLLVRVLNLDAICIALADTELVQQGHKFKAVKGEITLTINGTLKYDPDGLWKKAPKFLQSFYGVIRKRWLKSLLEQEILNFSKEIYELNDTLKKFVELMSSDSFPAFHPSKRG